MVMIACGSLSALAWVASAIITPIMTAAATAPKIGRLAERGGCILRGNHDGGAGLGNCRRSALTDTRYSGDLEVRYFLGADLMRP